MDVTPTTTRANIPAPARRTTTFRVSIGTNAVTTVAGIPKPSITKSIINQPLSVAKLMGISTTTVKQSGLGDNVLPKDISGTYFINGRLFNIDSNGGIPNNLTVENVKNGNSNMRNPVLSSFATKILPYRGLGNGIRRAIKVYPEIDFIDDRAGNEFRCVIHRRVVKL